MLEAGAGVDIAAGHAEGRAALQVAVECGHVELISVLIRAGTDPNAGASNVAGRTCLQAAAANGRLDLVQLLLEANVEPRDWPLPKRSISTIPAAVRSGKGYSISTPTWFPC